MNVALGVEIFAGQSFRDADGLRLQSSFDRPASIQAALKFAVGPAKSSLGFCYRYLVTLQHHVNISLRVAVLLLFCGPYAIARFVVACIVNTFNRVHFGWARPHVSHERIEGFTPARADRNAHSAVSGETYGRGIVASSLHGVPDSVVGMSAHAVLSGPVADAFVLQASTRSRDRVSQVLAVNVLDSSTGASANPIVAPVETRTLYRPMQNNPSSARRASHVCSSHIATIIAQKSQYSRAVSV